MGKWCAILYLITNLGPLSSHYSRTTEYYDDVLGAKMRSLVYVPSLFHHDRS